MAIQAQPMHVYAGLPIDEATRREASPIGKSNRTAKNARQDEKLALKKRLGFSALGQGTRTTGRKLVTMPSGTPVIIDGSTAQSYSESTATSTSLGRLTTCNVSTSSLPTISTDVAVQDIEVIGDYLVIGYQGTSTVACLVIDRVTGTQVSPTNILTGLSGGSIVNVGSVSGRYAMFLTFTGATNIWRLYSYDTQTPGSAWVSVADNTAAPAAQYVSMASGSDRVFLAVANATNATIASYNQSGVVDAPSTLIGTIQSSCDVVVSQDKSRVWIETHFSTASILVLQRSSTAIATPIASATTSTTATNTNVRLCTGSGANNAFLFIDGTVGSSGVALYAHALSVAGSVLTIPAARFCTNVVMSGRGITMNGRTFVPVFGGGDRSTKENLQKQLTIVDVTDSNVTFSAGFIAPLPVAHLEPGLISFGPRIQSLAMSKLFRDGDSLLFGFTTESGGGGTALNCRLAKLDFASRSRWRSAHHARGTYLSGGVLTMLDTSSVVESGFIHAPHQPEATLAATGITGTYNYVATYEDVDANGNWVVSGVSAVRSVTAANQNVTLTVQGLSISYRALRRTPRVSFYRTTNGGNPPYYRLGSVNNNPASGLLSIIDATVDASLVSQPKLYAPNLPGTANESLDRRAPPGLSDIVSYAGMLVGIKGSSVIYSGQEVYGESTWFNPVFEVPITNGGDFVGLEPIDGTLFLFKSDRIFAISGVSPSDNGSSGGLGEPRLIASDVGCTDVNSIVATSLGIFFRSARGIELLDRNGGVTFIGDAVHETVDAYPYTFAAVCDARMGLVRFSLAADTSEGYATVSSVTLCFDLTIQSWVSVDTYHGTADAQPVQSAALVRLRNDLRYAWIGGNGAFYAEKDWADSDACLDNGTWVPLTYELPPWTLGLQQEQRVFEMMALFDRVGAAGLTISAAYDYSPTYTDTKTWTEAETIGRRQLPFRFRPKGEAIQLRVSDTEPTTLGNGRGITFVGISADIAAKQGPNRGTPRLPGATRK